MKKISKSSINFYKKNGYLILKKKISEKDIDKISSRLSFFRKETKKSWPWFVRTGSKKSLIHSLHKDIILKKIIFEKQWYRNICSQLLNSKKPITWNCKSNLKKNGTDLQSIIIKTMSIGEHMVFQAQTCLAV